MVLVNDMSDFVNLIKKISISAVNSSNPVKIIYGVVEKVTPLQIKIDPKIILQESQLILTRNVTDYDIEMTVEHFTENTSSHNHEYKGKKLFTVHNALKVCEKVILIQETGGQKFLILDRVVS